MKIYYSVDDITDNCCNTCPVLNKDKDIIGIHIGSCKCKECKHCYGASSKRYPKLIGIGNKDGKLDISYDEWVKCSGMYDRPTLSMKIQKVFYDIKRKILNLFKKDFKIIMLKEFKKCKQILVSCHPRYWEDGEVNGVEDISFADVKGQGEPQMPCAEKIKDNHTSCIHSDHWAWRPIIDVETGQIKNWNKQVSAFIHYKVCDEFNCLFTDEKGFIITQYEGYVPPFMYPKQNGWGDYIIMDIDELGYIQHWDETLVHKFVNDLLNKK